MRTTPISDLPWDSLTIVDRQTVLRIIGYRAEGRFAKHTFSEFTPLVQQQILVAIKNATKK